MDIRDRPAEGSAQSEGLRDRIVTAAATLIAAGGRDAATTRAVAVAAGVQAPTIYRLFGDKRGLLDAVAQRELAAYIAEKSSRVPHSDPVQELRDGWDVHIAFGLAHPGLFSIMASDPGPRAPTPAIAAGVDLLRRRIRNIALAGRLQVSEARALDLLQAMGTGIVLTLLAQPESQRDPGVSAAARESVLAAITGEANVPVKAGPGGPAMALRASLDQIPTLSGGERLLLAELLNRIANGPPV